MEIPKGPLNITRTKTPAKGLNERSIVLQDAWPAQRPQAASHEVVGERELEAAEQVDVVVAQGREPLALCTGYASLDPTRPGRRRGGGD